MMQMGSGGILQKRIRIILYFDMEYAKEVMVSQMPSSNYCNWLLANCLNVYMAKGVYPQSNNYVRLLSIMPLKGIT